jgi:hypothetical protein
MDGESVLGEIGLLPFPPPTEPPPPTTTTVAPKASATSILPHPGGPCMGPLHVVAKVGTTRVPFMLEATESLCQLAPASQIRVDVCFPNGKPLRPGTYYVDWVWYGPLPTPTITVPVVGNKP